MPRLLNILTIAHLVALTATMVALSNPVAASALPFLVAAIAWNALPATCAWAAGRWSHATTVKAAAVAFVPCYSAVAAMLIHRAFAGAPDGQSGLIFVTLPFAGLAAGATVLGAAWCASRFSRWRRG